MNRNSQLRASSWAILASLVCGLFLVFSASAFADDVTDYSAAAPLDRMLTVQFTDDATARDQRKARRSVGADFEQDLAAPKLQQLSIPDGDSVTEAAIALRSNPKVEFVS